MKYIDAVRAFVNAKKASERRPKTIYGLYLTLEQDLGKYLGDRDLGDVKPADLDAWVAELVGRKYKPSSRRVFQTRAKEFFAWAVKHGDLVVSPAAALEAPKMDARVPKFLTPAQYMAIQAKAEQGGRDLMDVLTATGMRIGEFLLLRPEAVTDQGVLLDGRGKGRDYNYLPISPALRDWLRALPVSEHGPLFPGSLPTIINRMRHPSLAAGVPGVTAHSFRHTFAVWMLRAGQPLAVVKAWLGHKSQVTTEIYARLTNGNWEEERQALPARLTEWQPGFLGKGP